MKHLTASETLEATIRSGEVKASGSFGKLFILGLLGGAFIALAAAGSNMAAFHFLSQPEMVGVGKAVSGLVFAAGLVMVVLAGGELFTGNCLMVTGVIDGRISWAGMLRNWIIVYIANFAGSVLVAFLVVNSGLLGTDNGLLGTVTVNIALAKSSLPFGRAVILGILCNFLVCIAVWMATAADSTVGKIFSIFFPIWLFVTSGYEHSIANMYYIPAGIFAAAGSKPGLSWGSFFIGNLIPVTIGNIIGGAIFIGCAFYFALRKGNNHGDSSAAPVENTISQEHTA